MEKKIYKEPLKSEEETTINVLYSENMLSIYTNRVKLQRQFNKLLGDATKEYKIKRSIVGNMWEVSLNDKRKIQKIILRANMFMDKNIKIIKSTLEQNCSIGNHTTSCEVVYILSGTAK